MSEEIKVPEFLDVSPEAQAAADAAMDPNVRPPAGAKVAIDKKTGDEYFRWSEIAVIEEAASSRSPKGHTCFQVVTKIRPSGDPQNKNVGRKVWTRVYINFPVLAGAVQDDGLAAMNFRSVGTLQTLLRATGYAPREPGLKAALLKSLFPVGGMPPSPLVGKVVVMNLVNSPNKGENVKYDRQTQAESFLPVSQES